MKGNPVRLFRLVSSGLPIPVPAAPNPRSVVYVGNLAAAVLALLASPSADGPFFVRDARDLSTADMVRLTAAALGRPVRTVPVPRGLMRMAGRAGDLVSRVAHVPLSSDAVERFFGSLRVDASRLAEVAGFRPPVAAEEAFRATAAWYRSIA
jgi:nucleoside-diphosphate-sugar epimerase